VPGQGSGQALNVCPTFIYKVWVEVIEKNGIVTNDGKCGVSEFPTTHEKLKEV